MSGRVVSRIEFLDALGRQLRAFVGAELGTERKHAPIVESAADALAIIATGLRDLLHDDTTAREDREIALAANYVFAASVLLNTLARPNAVARLGKRDHWPEALPKEIEWLVAEGRAAFT